MKAQNAQPTNVGLDDGLGVIPRDEAHWYCLSARGVATLCSDMDDAKKVAAESDLQWRWHAPHQAVQLAAIGAGLAEKHVAEIERARNAGFVEASRIHGAEIDRLRAALKLGNEAEAAAAAAADEMARMRNDMADYFLASDASWRETCSMAAAHGVASVPIGPAHAAAIDKYNALRARYGLNGQLSGTQGR
jgi:hypothetical protein